MSNKKIKPSMEETKSEQRRPRGRPRKIVVEKDSQKIKELFSENGRLLKNDELENKILSKLEIASNSLVGSNKNLDLNNINQDPNEIQETINLQITNIDSQLDSIQKEYEKILLEVKDIEDIKDRLTATRLSISQIIEKQQNLIIIWEKNLHNLPANHFSADKSNFGRWIADFFGFPDEIALRSKIAQSEAVISQWNTKLVQINSILSETLVALVGYQNVLQTVELIRESYRNIRLNLGKVRRDLEIKLKDHKNNQDNQVIMQNYLDSIQNLKSLGPTFSESASKNNEFVAKMLQNVELNPDKFYFNLNFNPIKNIKNQDQS